MGARLKGNLERDIELLKLRQEFYAYVIAGIVQKDIALALGLETKYFSKLVNGSISSGPAAVEHMRKAVELVKQKPILVVNETVSLLYLATWCGERGINPPLTAAVARKLLEGQAYVRSSV